MLIVCNNEEYDYLMSNCDGRCAYGEWCIFADGANADLCPLDVNNNMVIVEDKAHKGLKVKNNE